MQVEEIADPIAVEGHRDIPVKLLEGLRLRKPGAGEAGAEIFLFAAIDFVLQGELEEVERGEGGLLRVAGAVGEPGQRTLGSVTSKVLNYSSERHEYVFRFFAGELFDGRDAVAEFFQRAERAGPHVD